MVRTIERASSNTLLVGALCTLKFTNRHTPTNLHYSPTSPPTGIYLSTHDTRDALRKRQPLTLSSCKPGRGAKYGLASASLALRRCRASSLRRPCKSSARAGSRGTPLCPSAARTFDKHSHFRILHRNTRQRAVKREKIKTRWQRKFQQRGGGGGAGQGPQKGRRPGLSSRAEPSRAAAAPARAVTQFFREEKKKKRAQTTADLKGRVSATLLSTTDKRGRYPTLRQRKVVPPGVRSGENQDKGTV